MEIKIKGKLAENIKEVKYMINYLMENHPLPGKTLIIHPLSQDKVRCGKIMRAAAYIQLGPRTDTEIKVKLCVGKNKELSAFGLARSIAHEYCHALQHYRDGLDYSTQQETMEKEARAFSHNSVAAIMRLMIEKMDL